MRWMDRLIDQAIARRTRRSVAPLEGWTPHVACWDCGIAHDLPKDMRQAFASAQGFFERHAGHAVNWFERPALAGLWTPNADVKQARQAIQTMTVTNLHSLASSPTAGWQGAVVDNSANLFLNAHVMTVLDYANTAPANSKASFLFAYGGIEAVYTNPCSGTEGALTLVDVTTTPQSLKLIGIMPYTTQDEVAEGGPFEIGLGFGGILPTYWGVAIINHSGAALAGSGNTVKYQGIYGTVI